MLESLKNAMDKGVWEALTVRFRKHPIDSSDSLADFVQTRASYVCQTSLYGYLKNRMGIKYPEMFADEVMAKSINIAKWRTYGSCLADLSIYAAGYVGKGRLLSENQANSLARLCFERAVAETFDDADAMDLKTEVEEAFAARLAKVEWDIVAEGENAFLQSPVDLLQFAPIAEELKAFDRDIVINSTRFRWRDIRNQFKERANPEKISSDFLATSDQK